MNELDAKAYLAGVLVGDGYLTPDGVFGLHVKDFDFALAFSQALADAFNIVTPPKPEKPYWRVRVKNKSANFHLLCDYEPEYGPQTSKWLRGFFDSEGNVQLIRLKTSPNAWNRRVALYNTELKLLERAHKYLNRLDIEANISATKAHKHHSHFGSKVVYELKLRSSKRNYQIFLKHIGSSISRKQKALIGIPHSYSDISKYSSLGGKRGSETRWGSRTHCLKGHELSGDNLVIRHRKDRKIRRCRECLRRWVRESRQRKRDQECTR